MLLLNYQSMLGAVKVEAMSPSSKTCVVIPALNAEDTIGAVVHGILQHALTPLVVDDGSVDRTRERAHQAGAAVLNHPRNRGKGFALVAGFRWALEQGMDLVVTMDADGQHHHDDLPGLLEPADRAALVIGQRQLDLQAMPRASFIGNCVSTFWISLFCGRQFPDTQCGFRVYSRQLLASIPFRGGRFETETEILMRASLMGLRVEWVPIRTIYNVDGETPHKTNFNNFYDSLRVIGVVLRSTRFPRG